MAGLVERDGNGEGSVDAGFESEETALAVEDASSLRDLGETGGVEREGKPGDAEGEGGEEKELEEAAAEGEGPEGREGQEGRGSRLEGGGPSEG